MADERKPKEDVLYPSTPTSVLKANLERLGDAGMLSVAEQEQEVQAFTPLLDYGGARFNNQDLDTLHTVLTETRLTPPTEERVQAWGEESRRMLREQYGAAEAERLTAQTKAFIAKHPTLKALLDDSPIGSHPKVVALLTERARRAG